MTNRTRLKRPGAARGATSPSAIARDDAPLTERRAALCAELARLIEQRTGADGGHETRITALTFWRFSQPTELTPGMQQPAVYVVVQGRKHVELGGETYVYDPSQYLAVSLDLPVMSRVVEASPETPYLCMTLRVDPRELAALIVETGRSVPRDDHDGRGLFVSPLETPLLDGLLRLVRLLDDPEDIPILAPLILRELYFRLLQGEQQGRLAELAIGDGRVRRVAGAIAWIKEHFAKPLQVDTLAKGVNMSPSALHRHFAAVTGLSPIQYQKRLRLEEARRVLLAGTTTAEQVAYAVGYESPSQFSREYARLFGQPPRKDAERLRAAATDAQAATP
jgi:AraC-like DNA-binding protein